MPGPTSSAAMTVSELTGHIKAVVEATFPSLWVAGEISDLSRPRSGHIYFTLKDDTAQIRGVMWRSVASRLAFDLHDGQAVLCMGDVEVYEARGTYQIVVRKVEPQGLGALQLAFAQLQAKLHAEGLFAAERKRAIPATPRRIAVITSPSGAAIRDFLQAAANRNTSSEIIVIPASVQGAGASAQIVAGIRAAHRLQPRPDVLVLCRGGGSLEDLWCFNEEIVVRAVAASEIPTVSAIGHEIDVTLCDFAADVRALTPTDAATRVLADANMVRQQLTDAGRRLVGAVQSQIDGYRQLTRIYSERPCLRRPLEIVHSRARLLDEMDLRLERAVAENVRASRDQVRRHAAALSALSPLGVLSRGYSVTMSETGQAIVDTDQVAIGDRIITRLRHGQVESRVDTIQPES